MIYSLNKISKTLLDEGFSLNEKTDLKSRELKYHHLTDENIMVNQTNTDDSIVLDYWMYDVKIDTRSFDFQYSSPSEIYQFETQFNSFLRNDKYIDFFIPVKNIDDVDLRQFAFGRFKSIPSRFHTNVGVKTDLHLVDENIPKGSILIKCYLPGNDDINYYVCVLPNCEVTYQFSTKCEHMIKGFESQLIRLIN